MTPSTRHPLARRTLGRTGQELSIIGFGGIVVMNVEQPQANNYVAEAFDRGVNYFDVAPMYGNAEERLGPALRPYRDRVFLACKTHLRDRKEAQANLENSLRLAQTDHFDLYQLHALQDVKEDVEKVFAPGGVMDMIIEARKAGKIRHVGFSAHSEAAALAAMEQFDFDTILFPFNFAAWMKGEFGPKVHAEATRRNMGLLALKGMANGKWPGGSRPETAKWDKAWYEPIDKREQARLAMRFTLGLPVHAALPPGHWELFTMALDLAQSEGGLPPLTEAERTELAALATQQPEPIFEKATAAA